MTFLKSSFLIVTRCLLLVLVTAVCLYAQPSPGNPPPPENPPIPDDQPVPITGVEYLLLSGGILGGYKMFKNRHKKKDL